MDYEGDDPGGASRRAKFRQVTWRDVLSWQHAGNACRTFEEFRSKVYWFGSVAGGVVTVTGTGHKPHQASVIKFGQANQYNWVPCDTDSVQ